MIILMDTREHKEHRERITQQIEKLGHQVRMQALETGDYAIQGKDSVRVDRKHDLNEVLNNLCSKDSSRFWREIRRSKDDHVKLIFLVQHGRSVKKLTDVAEWKSKYSRVSGRDLMEKMYRAAIGWDVQWIFCERRNTGRQIVRLLDEYDGNHDR